MNWESRQWAKPLGGRGGGTQLFRNALLSFFFSTYTIILGLHTYIFTIESAIYCCCFLGGGDGHVPPGIYAPVTYTHTKLC